MISPEYHDEPSDVVTSASEYLVSKRKWKKNYGNSAEGLVRELVWEINALRNEIARHEAGIYNDCSR